MKLVERGARRTSKPDIFVSHSSRDKAAALRLATALNYCATDVWLDEWELQVGQSLTDEIARAMDEARYIAILITENYNQTVWTKTEYKKALAREQKEGRPVMLPLIVGKAEVPPFLEDKIYIDLRDEYFRGILRIVGMIHQLSPFRVSSALNGGSPASVLDIWVALEKIGFQPYVVLGKDDFDEVLEHGGYLIKEDLALFSPDRILSSPEVSSHVKALIQELK